MLYDNGKTFNNIRLWILDIWILDLKSITYNLKSKTGGEFK